MTIERREKCGFDSPKSLISDRGSEKVRYQFNWHRNDLASINRECIHLSFVVALFVFSHLAQFINKSTAIPAIFYLWQEVSYCKETKFPVGLTAWEINYCFTSLGFNLTKKTK